MAACANPSTCLKEGEGSRLKYRPTICMGNSSCEGELDWCREERRKEEKCPDLFTRCVRAMQGGNGTKSIPGQCIKVNKLGDGKEKDCLDRSDEDPFQERVNGTDKETIIDFARLNNCTDKYGSPGLDCGVQEESENCVPIWGWCSDDYSKECPVLGAGIRTNHPALCSNTSFWRRQTCKDLFGQVSIRCQAGNSGQCISIGEWGLEGVGAGYWEAGESCKDDSDKYRPIKPLTEPGRQQPQGWKIEPVMEETYNRYYRGNTEIGPFYGANYRKDSSTGVWMIPESNPFKVPSISEEDFKNGFREYNAGWIKKAEWANFYNTDDYVKDKTTGRMVAAPTVETCRANHGFVCKVRLDAGSLL